MLNLFLYSGNLVGVVLSGAPLFADAQRAGLTRTAPGESRESRRHALWIGPRVGAFRWPRG